MKNSSFSGKRLKEERKKLGLSQAQIAEICGISGRMWGDYERGISQPKSETLFLFERSGIDINYVMGGEHTVTPLNQYQETLVKEVAARLFIHLNITPQEIADELGIDYPYFESVMEGKIAPSLSVLAGLVNSYGIDAQWLLTGRSYQPETVVVDDLPDEEKELLQRYRSATESGKTAIRAVLAALPNMEKTFL